MFSSLSKSKANAHQDNGAIPWEVCLLLKRPALWFFCQQYSSVTTTSLFPTRTASSTAIPGHPTVFLYSMTRRSQAWVLYPFSGRQLRKTFLTLVILKVHGLHPTLEQFWISPLIISLFDLRLFQCFSECEGNPSFHRDEAFYPAPFPTWNLQHCLKNYTKYNNSHWNQETQLMSGDIFVVQFLGMDPGTISTHGSVVLRFTMNVSWYSNPFYFKRKLGPKPCEISKHSQPILTVQLTYLIRSNFHNSLELKCI